jgi:hypothetical protein
MKMSIVKLPISYQIRNEEFPISQNNIKTLPIEQFFTITVQDVLYYIYGVDGVFSKGWEDLYNAMKPIHTICNNIAERYYVGKYHLIEVYQDEDMTETELYNVLRYKLRNNIYKYSPILTQCKNLISQLVKPERKLVIDTTKTGDNKDTKGYSNTVTGSSDTSSMNEISPINATLGDIVTPNNKNVAEFGSTTSKTGTDTIDYQIRENVLDTHTETSPEYYKEILKIYEKYNIPTILDNCYRSIIYEFNTSL